ncbi:hypothetical protein JCM10296v2_004326 [Rhodotorula toruloides]
MAALLHHPEIKQEPLEATLAATHQVVAAFAPRAARKMAPHKEGQRHEEHTLGGKKAKSNQGEPVCVVKQEEEDELDSEVDGVKRSLEQQLEQVIEDIKKSDAALGHWKSVVDKAAAKVNKERLHKFALECLLRVVNGDITKSESDVSKMEKGVDALAKQRKRHLHEVGVIQDVLLHHAVNGAKSNPLKPFSGHKRTMEEQEERILLAEFVARLAKVKQDLFRSAKALEQATQTLKQAAANLNIEVKNKAILVEFINHVRHDQVKAEHHYSVARKHLVEVSLSRQHKVIEVVAIKRAVRRLPSRATPQPMPLHL